MNFKVLKTFSTSYFDTKTIDAYRENSFNRMKIRKHMEILIGILCIMFHRVTKLFLLTMARCISFVIRVTLMGKILSQNNAYKMKGIRSEKQQM